MDTLLAFIREHGALSYALLFAYCALKSGALPLFAGYAAHTGALSLSVVALAVFAGGYLGDEARFHAVRRLDVRALERRPKWAHALARGRALFERYGTAYIFLYRYPKGLRTIGALPVGLTAMPWRRFSALNAASAGLWTGLMVGAGYLFGAAIDRAVSEGWQRWSLVLLVVVLLGAYLAWRQLPRLTPVAERNGAP